MATSKIVVLQAEGSQSIQGVSYRSNAGIGSFVAVDKSGQEYLVSSFGDWGLEPVDSPYVAVNDLGEVLTWDSGSQELRVCTSISGQSELLWSGLDSVISISWLTTSVVLVAHGSHDYLLPIQKSIENRKDSKYQIYGWECSRRLPVSVASAGSMSLRNESMAGGVTAFWIRDSVRIIEHVSDTVMSVSPDATQAMLTERPGVLSYFGKHKKSKLYAIWPNRKLIKKYNEPIAFSGWIRK
jgi:hypothetical protein